jgi:hypothetical protein
MANLGRHGADEPLALALESVLKPRLTKAFPSVRGGR